MKKLMGLLFLIPSMGFALTAADIKKVKQAEAFYELEDSALTKEQRGLCSEGFLEFDTVAGFLMLGPNSIAIDVLTDEDLKRRPTDEATDSCVDRISNKIEKNTLTFSMATGCGSDMFKSETNRQITFSKNKLVYTQKNKFNGQETEVTCTLKKVPKEKKSWKVEPLITEG